MEQRIGTSSQPLKGAGFDPAFVPGLTSPVTAEPSDAKPAEADDAEAVVDSEEVENTDTGAESGSRSGADAVSDTDAETETEADADSEDEEAQESDASAAGPVFEASDRRARIAADARGVRLRLDEEECEFRWDEIGAVETETPRFGKRYTITVHTPDRRWYPIEIEATSRARFAEWDEQLDAVLDAYFDEGDADVGDAEADNTDAEPVNSKNADKNAD
ncbi:hypothetical protein ACWGH3_03610 [Streptomyces sp. NPDC054884]|uniref:hypothetical protein n=1 Tax=Streptomyces sp. ME08-AFT2 TaxID=3028683 RepID=UPI0029BF7451|nr:hypothetical protein [Streptomyces sp. ME08-AFT2]MDX3307941.1 hypothetical protein [Streptomyces sp. ME08-AFT2]